MLAIVTVSGCLLTFLYDRTSPFPARVAMGATSGMVVFATTGYLFALWLGLGAASITLSLIAVLLPFLLLLRPGFRELAVTRTRSAIRNGLQAARRPDRWTIGTVLFYCVLTVLLSAVFASAAYETPLGLFSGVRNNLGDLPLHLQIINSFSQGQNIPAQDPTFAGVRFAYPFMVDFLAAMLIRSGSAILSAMWAENMFAALALIGMLHYWTLLLTRSRAAGLIAPLLVLFSGGLGWAWLFQDLHESSHGLIPLLGSLPHSYTIMDAPGILRWGNSLTTLFVPQRSILFGMPVAILIFCQWWLAISRVSHDPKDQLRQATDPRVSLSVRRMVAAGVFAGLMPLVHTHTFLVIMAVGVCLAILFLSAWREWLYFFSTAIVIALPEVLWLAGGVKLQSYFGWQTGWDHDHFNPVLFWLANTGLFIPILLFALLSRRENMSLAKSVLKFYSPFLLCFIMPNLFRVAPWIWDNIKVLFWWYVASAPLVAWVIAQGWRQRSRGVRWLASGALVALLLAGALDVLALVTGSQEFLEFDPDGIAIAKVISNQAEPRAVVLHAPTYNSPVFLTGRQSLMGYAGWMWSRGLDDSTRQAEIHSMYAGDPEAEALLHRYGVGYVLIGPAEVTSLQVNLQFWSRYPRVAQIGPYLLYRINSKAERVP